MKYDRLSDMEHYIAQNGTITLYDLCRYYNVSMSTVRRDVAELIQKNGFRKVYGGIVHESQLQIAESTQPTQPKTGRVCQLTGMLAASLIKEGMSIFLDCGFAASEILPYIAAKSDITIISHNLAALTEASKYASLHVIALGGIYNRDTASFSGKNTLDELSSMSIDLVFLTAAGVTPEHGLTSSSYMDARIKRIVAKRNRALVLLADHSVFGKNALISFCEIDRLQTIISDSPLPCEYLRASEFSEIQMLTP